MRRAPLFLIAIAFTAANASADVLDCTNQTLPDCLRVSPDGSIPYAGTLVRSSGQPHSNEEIRLIFSASCTDLVECSGLTPLVFTDFTDGGGFFSFSPEIGGCCQVSGAGEFEVDPGAVTCASYPSVGSPDADGSGEVDLVDFTLFQGEFLMQDSCFDYVDCDDQVLLTDFTFFQSKFLAACP